MDVMLDTLRPFGGLCAFSSKPGSNTRKLIFRILKIIPEHFSKAETTKEHNGYWFSVGRALTIVILGSVCGLRNVSQIHQWASHQKVKSFLEEHFGIRSIPCYSWLLSLLKIIDPKSLNQCFIQWSQSLLPQSLENLTISFDGKTICSTRKMDSYDEALHIVNAHIAELALTVGQTTVSGKSNNRRQRRLSFKCKRQSRNIKE